MATLVEQPPPVESPLVTGLERIPVPSTSLVVFAATGDLARRKLLPAIYNLARDGALPDRFELIGVETVQNLMALRFANALFEPVWNRNFVDHVEITAAEEIGIEGRAGCYAALRLCVSNWRWADVPFYLRTGKRLARKLTEIAVILKPVPHLAFQAARSPTVDPNQIVLTLQPDEAVSVSIGARIPGPLMPIRPVNAGPPEADALLDRGRRWRRL